MINQLVNKPLDLLENLVQSLEKYEQNEQRPRVFAKDSNEPSDNNQLRRSND